MAPARAKIAADTAAATAPNDWNFFLASSANLVSQMQAAHHSPRCPTPAVANGFSSSGNFRRIRVRSGLVKTPVVPTAQSVPSGVPVIPCKRLLEFRLLGLAGVHGQGAFGALVDFAVGPGCGNNTNPCITPDYDFTFTILYAGQIQFAP